MTDPVATTATGGAEPLVPAVPPTPGRTRKYRLKDVGLAYLMLLPSALVFAFFFFEPFGRLVGWGRYQPIRGGADYRDVGVDRYTDVLGGQDFRDGMTHSIQFVLLTVPIGLALGVLLAVAAHRRLKGIKVFQAIFSSTIATSVAVSSVLFLFILNSVIGVVRGSDELYVPFDLLLCVVLVVPIHRLLKERQILQVIVTTVLVLFIVNRMAGPLLNMVGLDSLASVGLDVPHLLRWDIQPQFWNQQSEHALWAAALPSIWQNLGLSFVIVLAGLQAIPDEVVEAATLDGYGPIRRFFRITLPLISPVLLFLVVVLVVFGFQAFAQIEVITNGGPAGASETLVYKIFYEAQDLPAAAVMSVGLFLVTLVISALQFTLLNRRVHYGDN